MVAPFPDNDPGAGSLMLRRALLALLGSVLAIACVLVLRPFLAPIVWAAILAYVTWPLYRRLRIPFRRFSTAAASCMTLLVVVVAIVPLYVLLGLTQHELVDAYRSLTTYLAQGPHVLPAAVRDVPGLGTWLQNAVDRYTSDPEALGREFTDALRPLRGQLAALLGGVGRNVGKSLIALLTLFFFYRDGDLLVRQLAGVGTRLFGNRLDRYVAAAGAMTRAVVYGLLVTALAQGLIAGLGYWILGLQSPVLLGALTGLLSLAPLLGTAFVWGPMAAGLLLEGHTWKGILLLAWGALLVHPVDNVMRPFLISNATRVPFLLVVFGALGGLAAFGLVGLFVGPVVLGIASAIWREWTAL